MYVENCMLSNTECVAIRKMASKCLLGDETHYAHSPISLRASSAQHCCSSSCLEPDVQFRDLEQVSMLFAASRFQVGRYHLLHKL